MNALKRTEMDLNESEIDLNESEHFLKANLMILIQLLDRDLKGIHTVLKKNLKSSYIDSY